MKFERKHIARAVEELNECLGNILNAERSQYGLRIQQLFLLVKNNEILNFIVNPYLELKLDIENIGFVGDDYYRKEFVIPENDDEEIALILEVLKIMSENEGAIEGGPFSVYMKNSPDENLYLFNKNIVEPAFNKLTRKLQYRLEDISGNNDNKFEPKDIMIINIEKLKFNASNSMIAIGNKISQQSENVFERIKNEIQKGVNDEKDKTELLSYVIEMENNKANKEAFKSCYDKFINRLGTYMTIIGPLLPFLVEYFE